MTIHLAKYPQLLFFSVIKLLIMLDMYADMSDSKDDARNKQPYHLPINAQQEKSHHR